MILTQLNGRQILYENVRHSPGSILDTPIQDKWIAFVVANNEDRSLAGDIVKKSLKNNVGYVCCAGEACASLELSFDLEIIKIEGYSENDDVICTASDNNFDEALFFAIYAATINDIEYPKVICLDLTKDGVYETIVNSINDMSNKYNH